MNDQEYEAAEAERIAALTALADSRPPDLYGSPTEAGRCTGCGVKLGAGYRTPGCREDCRRG